MKSSLPLLADGLFPTNTVTPSNVFCGKVAITLDIKYIPFKSMASQCRTTSSFFVNLETAQCSQDFSESFPGSPSTALEISLVTLLSPIVILPSSGYIDNILAFKCTFFPSNLGASTNNTEINKQFPVAISV
jgi:hypothetical protein